jgi:hypothetical protein
MFTFESEERNIQGSLQRKLPQLEDIGNSGRIIAEEIHVLVNKVKDITAQEGQENSVEEELENLDSKLSEIRNGFTSFYQKSGAVIDDLTKTLTEVR